MHSLFSGKLTRKKQMSAYQTKHNTIYCGDNLTMLQDIPDESIDLCYIDPPFNSNRNYEVFWGDTAEKRAFHDRFGDAEAYINYMRPRIQQIHRVLKKTGSFYYHCDWHASHYVKIMLDEIFGINNFQNEIIWQRTNVHNDAKKRLPIVTDSIYYFTKSSAYIFNRIYQPYKKEYIDSFYKYEDDKGRFRLGDLAKPDMKGYRYEYKGYKPPKNGWRCPIETMNKWDSEGLIHFPKKKDGRLSVKRYLDINKGTLIGNLWNDIQNIQGSSNEKLGYPTQKPLALLERIIKLSSCENDIILDAFCGCGTTLVAAQQLKRKWIGIDISPTACRVMADRLYHHCGITEGKHFFVRDLHKTEDELMKGPHFEFQNWAVIALGGIPNKRKSGDFGIDGKLYPIEVTSKKKSGEGLLFDDSDYYFPIQVKQKEKAGRPDIDSFETAIRRDGRKKGYFVAFGFSKDAIEEIKRLDREGEIEIIPITVTKLIEMSAA